MASIATDTLSNAPILAADVAVHEIHGSDPVQHADGHHGSSDVEKAVVLASNTDHSSDAFCVRFGEPFDAQNPKDWPRRKKILMTSMMGASTFNRIIISTVLAPALSSVATELHISSNVETVMALSAFLIASAFAPLIFGPLSELYGRKPILLASNAWFLIWNLICGFANSAAVLITARVFAGIGASAVYALGSGVLGDIWPAEERGKSMAIYSMILLTAPAIGPILGGYVTEYTTWRWSFWSTSALIACTIVLEVFLYHESYPAIILLRRTKTLRKSTGDDRWYTARERLNEGQSVTSVIMWNLSRPLRMLATHPIVQIFAVYSGFLYGVLYLIISSYSTLWMQQYGESAAQSSLHYIASAGGELLGAQVGAPLMDLTYRALKAKSGGIATPEHRIPLMAPGIVIISFGFIILGWSAQFRVFWVVVDIGCFIANFGLAIAGSAMQGYIIDTYPEHASSASAAAQVLRSLAAFGFPLFAPSMFDRLGYGWGSTLIALTTITIGMTVPLMLHNHGAALRAAGRSSY